MSGRVKRYICNICGYVCDLAVGDTERNIFPGTAFEDLPDDWACPVCGASEWDFSPEGAMFGVARSYEL